MNAPRKVGPQELHEAAGAIYHANAERAARGLPRLNLNVDLNIVELPEELAGFSVDEVVEGRAYLTRMGFEV